MAKNNKGKHSWDTFMEEKLQFIIRGEPVPPFISQSEYIPHLLGPKTEKQIITPGYVDEIDKTLEEIGSKYELSNEFDLGKCIILPENKHGNFGYPDLNVSMHRLKYSSHIEDLANFYGFEAYYPAKEENGTNYIGGIEWNNLLLLNSVLGNITLNLRQFMDLKNLLEEGIFSKKKIFNGNGKQISQDTLSDIYSEIFLRKEPNRGEFIDNSYIKNINGNLLCYSNHKIEKGMLIPQRITIIEKYIEKPCFIDSEKCNNLGLPLKEGGSLFYQPPSNGSVTGIIVNKNLATINCSIPKKTKNYIFGIRPARVR